MGKHTFSANARIQLDGREHHLVRKVTATTWQIEEFTTRRITELSETDLQSLYAEGRLIFLTDYDKAVQTFKRGRRPVTLDEIEWLAAKTRRAYVLAIRGLARSKRVLARAVEQTHKLLNVSTPKPSPSSVLRWHDRYYACGEDIHSLAPGFAQSVHRKPRYPDELLSLVEQSIDEIYLKPERPSVEETLNHAITATDKENELRPKQLKLPRPTRRLLRRLIEAIPAYDRCAARHGDTYAKRKFRAVLQHHTTLAPLERAEIDHTILNLIVVDDESGLPLGRPYVTACIDNHTRCVLGIYIGFEPPSYLSVARCLRHAFLPKTDLVQHYPEIRHPWEAHGVMAILVVDNGQEFHSDALELACEAFGVEIHYTPRKTPWLKGKIERFLGTLNREVAHISPGTTFESILAREEYDPARHAVVSLSVIQEIVHRWIADVYHQRPHRILKAPPAAAWRNSIAADEIPLPDDPKRLDALLGRPDKRKLTHQGIEFDCLVYNSPEMTDLRRRYGAQLDVDIRYNDEDIGSLHVIGPDGEIYEVPALNGDYAQGLSRWQHKIIRRYAARILGLHDDTGWREAKRKISEIVRKRLGLGKSRKTMSRGARYLHAGDKEAPAPKGSGTGTRSRSTARKAQEAAIPTTPAAATQALVLPLKAVPGGPDTETNLHTPPLSAPRQFAPLQRDRRPSP
ncbi:Mu transposase C-terminal domain-containing protein [Rhodoferax sp. BAB1]|uniref:Mu transposase C-terminal domain-containing protein n=1 Tax=Rhodoferax sp. BAB1 TaxID=2741720 RepID=UPI0015750656|nr:Mu transposase C-terminal domain-containing protein [Rhodoferax sp. BAB1]QKO20877.1 DDE-type integrase/transposase/recombinase [Rhodoferax sp. BAB1]